MIDIDELCEESTCPQCGREHSGLIEKVLIGEDAISRMMITVRAYAVSRIFLLADKNTYRVAGERVERQLSDSGYEIKKHIFEQDKVTPDEKTAGAALLHYDSECEMLIAVGSGVINDIGKLIASVAHVPYVIVATAPSMDGYASTSSSMCREGLKVTIASKSAEVDRKSVV